MGNWPTWRESDGFVHGSGQTARVVDSSGAILPGATITVRNPSIGFEVTVRTDPAGRYFVAALPLGTCTVRTEAPGFRAEVIEALNVDAGRTLVRDAFRGDAFQCARTVALDAGLLSTTSMRHP